MWDVTRQLWTMPLGTYTLRVGTSSKQLPLDLELAIEALR